MANQTNPLDQYQITNTILNSISVQNQIIKPLSTVFYSQNSDSQLESTFNLKMVSKRRQRSKMSWSPQEDAILMDNYAQLGSQWSRISAQLSQKTNTSVKNRFYSCIRRLVKKLVMVQKQKKLGNRQPIQEQCLLTIIELGRSNSNYPDQRFKNINMNRRLVIEVRDLIVREAGCPEGFAKQENIQKLVLKIMEVRPCLKFINAKRARRKLKQESNEKQSEGEKKETYCNSNLNIKYQEFEEGEQNKKLPGEGIVYYQSLPQIQQQRQQRPQDIQKKQTKGREEPKQAENEEMGMAMLGDERNRWRDVFEEEIAEKMDPLFFF